MGNLIKGSELGAYKTIAMSLGVAEKRIVTALNHASWFS